MLKAPRLDLDLVERCKGRGNTRAEHLTCVLAGGLLGERGAAERYLEPSWTCWGGGGGCVWAAALEEKEKEEEEEDRNLPIGGRSFWGLLFQWQCRGHEIKSKARKPKHCLAKTSNSETPKFGRVPEPLQMGAPIDCLVMKSRTPRYLERALAANSNTRNVRRDCPRKSLFGPRALL